MAMLAEPRRKQKWTLNPRGKLWSEDSNKFGQKMLEKMGWTAGKGLGANEQGTTEHISVSLKNDSSGIGFKPDAVDRAWTEHQDGFNELLKELRKGHNAYPNLGHNPDESSALDAKDESLSGKSLELKSKESRARVHYQRFTRGKDVNKYSRKDLANIFGQKDLNEIKDSKDEKMEANDEKQGPTSLIGAEDKRNGVTTINRGSIALYFKNKVSSSYRVPENDSVDRLTDTEEEAAHAGFGFSSGLSKKRSVNKEEAGASAYEFVNPCLKLDSPEDISALSKKHKSSTEWLSERKFFDAGPSLKDRSKKSKEGPNVDCDCSSGIVNPALSLVNQSEESQIRNGQEYEVSRAQFGVANSAFDPEDHTSNKRRVTFNDHVEYSTDPVKKKTGKVRLDKFEVENTKHKRKRKYGQSSTTLSNGIVNEALDAEDRPAEIQDNELNEKKCGKGKRRKENRPSILETILETPEEDKRATVEESTSNELQKSSECTVIDLADSNSVEIGRKKKKRRRKDKRESIENDVNFDHTEARQDDATATDYNKQVENMAKTESKLAQGDPIAMKKRKRKHKDQEDMSNTMNAQEPQLNETKTDAHHKVEEKLPSGREVFDKENTSNGCDLIKEKEKKNDGKKGKKVKKAKSADQLVDDSPSSTEKVIEKSEVEDEDVLRSDLQANIDDTGAKTVPWNNNKPRMSKRLLKLLFQRNAISNFPGSNVCDIKGYGSSIW